MTRRSLLSLAGRAALGVGAGTLLVATLASPAQAATTSRTASCSAGGFTGYMKVTFDAPSFSGTTVRRIEYKIVKGSQKGGNKADVSWDDYGVLPTLEAITDSGIQDGGWHTLREANYYRGSGGVGAVFVFDKSKATDPHCNPRF